MTSKPRPSRGNPDDPDTPFLEWAFGAVGLALFIGAIIVTSLGMVGEREAPSISIKAEPATPATEHFRVGYSAFNSGDETAADVHLVARLLSGSEIVEEQDASIDLLPGGSTSRGGFFFNHDPSRFTVEIVPVSYQEP